MGHIVRITRDPPEYVERMGKSGIRYTLQRRHAMTFGPFKALYVAHMITHEDQSTRKEVR